MGFKVQETMRQGGGMSQPYPSKQSALELFSSLNKEAMELYNSISRLQHRNREHLISRESYLEERNRYNNRLNSIAERTLKEARAYVSLYGVPFNRTERIYERLTAKQGMTDVIERLERIVNKARGWYTMKSHDIQAHVRTLLRRVEAFPAPEVVNGYHTIKQSIKVAGKLAKRVSLEEAAERAVELRQALESVRPHAQALGIKTEIPTPDPAVAPEQLWQELRVLPGQLAQVQRELNELGRSLAINGASRIWPF